MSFNNRIRVSKSIKAISASLTPQPLTIVKPVVVRKKNVLQTKISKPTIIHTKQQRIVASPIFSAVQPTIALPKIAKAPAKKPLVNIHKASHKSVPPRKSGTRFITADVTPGDIERIKNVRYTGNGRILVIIGNGPSVAEIETQRLMDHPKIDIMSINKPDQRVWPTKFWTFFDVSQLNRHRDLWSNYRGILFNGTSIRDRRPGSMQLKHIPGNGFSLDLAYGIHIGRSSVFAAMQIANWMNYNKIYMLGVDMCNVNGKVHFYGVNPDVMPNVREGRFDGEASFYEDAANKLCDETKKKFTFCSSYLKYPFAKRFNHIDHQIAIEEILMSGNQLLC